jgi:hypothetical protein
VPGRDLSLPVLTAPCPSDPASDRTLDLARASRDGYATAGGREEALAEVEAWLDAHRQR